MPLHAQAQALLDMMVESGAPPIHEMSLEEARGMTAMIGELVGAGPEMAEIRELQIPVTGGSIRAKLYRATESPAGTIVWYHGGGWVIGGVDDFDAVCQLLAQASDCEVVSVDYRLAPEHRFPTAADDAYEALVWVADNVAEGKPLSVGGDSAGGNLSAVVALRTRDRNGPALAAQVLVYPVTDHDFGTGSYAEHGDTGLLLDRAGMVWFWDHYAPDVADRDSADASPLRASSHAGLAPAYVVIAEYDPLRDEGRSYADKLSAAGVDVTVRTYDDMLHGFFTMPNFIQRGNEAIADAGAFVRQTVAAAV
jgi:acetyl esterase